MSDDNNTRPPAGTIGWFDLTVDDAEAIRGFYESVVGWGSDGFDMGGYEDFCMMPPGSDDPVAGICYKRGSNADFPSQWMLYINVDNLDRSVEQCKANGGEIVVDPKKMGEQGRFCVIRDPAGAVCALFEPN